jgi:hypothetical protein
MSGRHLIMFTAGPPLNAAIFAAWRHLLQT